MISTVAYNYINLMQDALMMKPENEPEHTANTKSVLLDIYPISTVVY